MNESSPNESGLPTYRPPVDQLLLLGRPDDRRRSWPDYPALGLSVDDAPELLRMSTDESLHVALDDGVAGWGPVHAWRTLGQLRWTPAIAGLLDLLERDDDWALEELPLVFAMMGAPVLPELTAFLRDGERDLWARAGVVSAMEKIALAEPAERERVVTIVSQQLAEWPSNDHALNSFLVGALVDLKATETAPLMEEVFREGAVDLLVRGDWEDIQVELGLLSERVTPRVSLFDRFKMPHDEPSASNSARRKPGRQTDRQAKRKSRQKTAKASRRRNRRK